MSIELLISKLKELETDETIPLDDDDAVYLTDGSADNLPPLINEIVALADSELINNVGECIWDAHEVLKENGFRVIKGEGDSFGWLTGVIITTKGRIVYG